jgi:hypothetical protein
MCALTQKQMPTALPNFSLVDPDKMIARGGQPTDEGFRRLKDMGIKKVIKLNEDDEGDDGSAVFYGMTLVKEPINTLEQLFHVRQAQVDAAVEQITDHTYVHCLHGEDRTGVVCYFYRREYCGWGKDRAENEMMNHGFHKELHGLYELVEEDC